MKHKIIQILFVMLVGVNASAADYYVGSGDIAFATIGEALSHVHEGDKIYVEAGTYSENVTISTPGIMLLGANAYCEERASTRLSAESVITGMIEINASDVTINGFRFTDKGRVMNTTATPDSPISGFTFSYNVMDALVLEANDLRPMLRFGNVSPGADALLEANNHRYSNITIANNLFNGDNNPESCFVQICNACDSISIINNTFINGGRAVWISNSQDIIDVNHNRFSNISGDFTIGLQYMGESRAVMSICNNEFDNCVVNSADKYPVVLDQGIGSAHVAAASQSALTFSYNVIKNCKSVDSQFLMADAVNCAPVVLDTRFNRCDNSDVSFGMVAPSWESGSQCYYSGSTGLFDFEKASADYYVTPIGTQQHQYKLKTNAAAQSFDIDTETGDIYYIQTEGSGDGVLPLRVTRYLFRADKTTGRQYMYLTNASHGANMSVFRHNGKVWITTGGASIFEGHCKPQSSVLLPFVSGATADCGEGKTSFTYNGKTYQIIQFKNQWGKIGCYPAVDVDNRLFCENHASGSGKVRYAVYDLDDVLANGSNAKLIKAVIISNGSNRYENTDKAYADIVAHDDGFATSGWAMQGFDISGDMIYRHGGVGLHNADAYSFGGKSIPTIMQDCINWRDSVYVHRKPVLTDKIISAPNGEPEGVKIVRDAEGRPHMIMGIVWGTPSARTSTLVDFVQTSVQEYTIPKAVLSAATVPSAFSAMTLFPQSKSVKIEVRRCIGQITAVVSGPDAACFCVGQPERSGINIISDKFQVWFTPTGKKRAYNATLRVSAPNADDLFIPLKGNYVGPLSGVNGIEASDNNAAIVGYYDLNGHRLAAPVKGINIVKYSDGSACKIAL